jgi:uncharacterized cupredoxin-like copper-binding protein
MRLKLLAGIAAGLVFSSIAALADAGHSHDGEYAYGEPGDPAKKARVVEIIMRETDSGMEFVPDSLVIRKGEQIRFSMKNHGESDHEFVLGTPDEIAKHAEEMRKNPDMEHDDPNSRRLKSSTNGNLFWRFSKPGSFQFACLIPGHMEAGMIGTIVVKN